MEKQEFETKEELANKAAKIFIKHTSDGLEMQTVLHCLCNFTEFMGETLIDYNSYFLSASAGFWPREFRNPEHRRAISVFLTNYVKWYPNPSFFQVNTPRELLSFKR